VHIDEHTRAETVFSPLLVSCTSVFRFTLWTPVDVSSIVATRVEKAKGVAMHRFVDLTLSQHPEMLTPKILEEAKGQWLLMLELQKMEERVHVQLGFLETQRSRRNPETKAAKC
jgi:hypothetical protein